MKHKQKAGKVQFFFDDSVTDQWNSSYVTGRTFLLGFFKNILVNCLLSPFSKYLQTKCVIVNFGKANHTTGFLLNYYY